jgi:hypothetical protein
MAFFLLKKRSFKNHSLDGFKNFFTWYTHFIRKRFLISKKERIIMKNKGSFWQNLFGFLSIDIGVRGIVAIVAVILLFWFLTR